MALAAVADDRHLLARDDREVGVVVVERPVVALPALARVRGGVGAVAADLGLEAVGEAGDPEEAGRPQVGEHVLGGPVRPGRPDQREQAAPQARVAEAELPVDRVRDPIRAEDLLEQRRVTVRLPEYDRHVTGHDSVAEQLEHARGGELDLGTLAAGGVEGDGGAGIDALRRRVLEQAPLQVVQRRARLGRVVVVERRQLELPGPHRQELLMHPAHGLEREPAALIGERDRHIRVADRAENSQRVQLEAVEVVEPVDEHGRAAPGRLRPAPLARRRGQRVERAPCVQLRVHEPRRLEPVPVGPVDRRDLLRVLAAGPVARPLAKRASETRGAHRVTDGAQFREEVRRGAHEAGLGRGLGQHVEPRAAHRHLDDQLALEVRRLAPSEPGSPRDLPEQPAEAHHPRAEYGAALGQLALGVLDVGEGRHHQHRVLVEPRAETAQHLARLRGVRRAGYQLEGHVQIVATAPDRLTRARRARPRRRARPGSAPPAAARAPPGAPSPGSAA